MIGSFAQTRELIPGNGAYRNARRAAKLVDLFKPGIAATGCNGYVFEPASARGQGLFHRMNAEDQHAKSIANAKTAPADRYELAPTEPAAKIERSEARRRGASVLQNNPVKVLSQLQGKPFC